jgi:SAGA-associated factor 73
MAAIARSRPQPLMTRPLVDTRMKYKYIRIKEALHNAMAGSRGAGLFSTGPSHIDTSSRGLFSAGPASATGLNSATIPPPDSATLFGTGAFASPLGSATLDSPSFPMDGNQRRQSGVQSNTRQILPGQLPGPQRKQSVSSAV